VHKKYVFFCSREKSQTPFVQLGGSRGNNQGTGDPFFPLSRGPMCRSQDTCPSPVKLVPGCSNNPHSHLIRGGFSFPGCSLPPSGFPPFEGPVHCGPVRGSAGRQNPGISTQGTFPPPRGKLVPQVKFALCHFFSRLKYAILAHGPDKPCRPGTIFPWRVWVWHLSPKGH